VGIETAHSLLIDFLWGQGYHQVFVIPPSVVHSSRGRYRQSGARTDQGDAYVLADILRTDKARLQLWQPDHVLTWQIRNQVGLLSLLTHHYVQFSNRLRSVFWRYYPAALSVFSEIDSQITLEFVRRYSTPQDAATLTFAEFEAFTLSLRYPNPRRLCVCFAKLQQPQADPDTVLIFKDQAAQLATALLALVRMKITISNSKLSVANRVSNHKNL
jgi:hypothetical protein